MSFQPLGFRFEVRSPLPAETVKAAIRAKKRGWFEAQDSARGWIAGSFVCLWLSAFDSQGPMVFARIVPDNFGTRIVGRAGSDLNGIAYFLLIALMMGFAVYKLVEEEPVSLEMWAWIGVGALSLLFIMWVAHWQRRDAEPLIEFLQTAVTRK